MGVRYPICKKWKKMELGSHQWWSITLSGLSHTPWMACKETFSTSVPLFVYSQLLGSNNFPAMCSHIFHKTGEVNIFTRKKQWINTQVWHFEQRLICLCSGIVSPGHVPGHHSSKWSSLLYGDSCGCHDLNDTTREVRAGPERILPIPFHPQKASEGRHMSGLFHLGRRMQS